MKLLITLTALIISMNTYAKTIEATVDSSICAEIDPFAVGDACLIYLTKSNGEKLALLLGFDEFLDNYNEEDFVGEKVHVDSSLLSSISGNALMALRRMNDQYFYQRAPMNSFSVINDSEMKKFIRTMGTRGFSTHSLADGYSVKKLAPAKFEYREGFKTWAFDETKMKLKLWKHLIYKSGEFDHLSSKEKSAIAKDPKAYLEVDHLLEVYKIYEIKIEGKPIGYFMEVSDHIQAAEYEDGAWFDLYLDMKQNVLKAQDQSS